MTTAIASRPQDQRLLLFAISWQSYVAIGQALLNRAIHLTFDRGNLEISVPSSKQQILKKHLARLLETMTFELNIPIKCFGSTTLQREKWKCGLEPNESYYLANESLMRGRMDLDLEVDPPPDLAIEVEISRSLVPRLPIYAALGVPEIWRYNGETLQVLRLRRGKYVAVKRSPSFPFLPVGELTQFLPPRATGGETSILRSFVEWVRQLPSKE